MAELLCNSARTTLNGAIDNVQTTITVTNSTGFPNSGTFRIRIDAEIMTVTGVAANVWTVTRASESVQGVQVARAHGNLAAVAFRLTAGSLGALIAGGGGGSPGGATGNIQYNDSGAFAGNANLITNGSGSLTAAGNITSSGGTVTGTNLSGTNTGDQTAGAGILLTGSVLSLDYGHVNVWRATQTINLNAASAPTASTGTGLQLVGVDATTARFESDSFGAVAAFTARRANGTGASPTAILSGDQLGSFGFQGFYTSGGPAYSVTQANMAGYAAENWTSTALGTKVVIRTTPIGSTTLTDAATFGNDGSLVVAGALTASNFSGSHSGTSSGTNTGDQTTISGNAATATALQTARNINGVSFNGTANITVTADASTLTGTTLNATVVTSSLTSVGTITSGTWTGTSIAIANGGTGQTSASAAFNALSPMTTLGDVIYGGTSGTGTRLAGDTSNTRKFIRTLSSGGVATAPVWDTVTKTDVGLANVENTALSTWAGSANITTVGTLASGSIPYSLLTGTPTVPSAANPTGTIGTSAVNGSAATFMRSDAAPAFDLTIARTWTGVNTFAPTARSSGSASALTITGPLDTNSTLSTERIAVNVDLSASVQFATGALTTQRACVIKAPTYAFVAASTLATATTLSITGAPIAGTNATITNSYALSVEAGRVVILGGTSTTSTLCFANSSTAAAFSGAAGAIYITFSGVCRVMFDCSNNTFSLDPGAPINWSGTSGNAAAASDTGLKRVVAKVLAPTNGSSGSGWLQNTAGRARVTADVTNATATMANLTDLSQTYLAGRKYFGFVLAFANNSTGAEGLQFDLAGGSATFTSIQFGFCGTPLGATLGTGSSTAAGTAITATVVSTSDVAYLIAVSFVVNAAGTVIPRGAEVSHTTGTATFRLGSFYLMEDSPN